jgi:Reverse transcriptase (RNA-dependent DNA polymerase)
MSLGLGHPQVHSCYALAVAMCHGSFEPLVMFFGMTNSPSTFQNMMNDIMKDLIDHGVVIVFIDDILIYMETEEGHDDIV